MDAPCGWRTLFRKYQTKFPSKYKVIEEHLISNDPSTLPPINDVFGAFELTKFKKVRVVILGQDPYPTRGHAMGLSFSVHPGVRVPQSLQRIYKEIEDDLGVKAPPDGDLSSWAKQGVLLLNSALTVREGNPNAYASIWSHFTDYIIEQLSLKQKNIVFILWGKFAKDKGIYIKNKENHRILEAGHPSPMNQHGFFGCKHFSKCNNYLQRNDLPIIKWV